MKSLNTVTKNDFNELKDIVKELMDVQKRTEVKVGSLRRRKEKHRRKLAGLIRLCRSLVEAQKRTEVKVGGLQRHKRTEVKVEDLRRHKEKHRRKLAGL